MSENIHLPQLPAVGGEIDLLHYAARTMAAPTETAKLHIFEDETKVSDQVCKFLIEVANHSIEERDLFYVGLSGGSAAKFLCNGLPTLKTDWSKWRVFFCDERHVPFNDNECTYKFYKDNLMSKVPLSEENIFPDNPDVSVADAAKQYEQKLRDAFASEELPRFDLLLLGMGPDGHTCSLFPGHPLLDEKSVWVAPISDSPKPPPERITLTYPVILNCRNAVFVSCGSGKAEMVKRVLEDNEQPALPAARVQPHSGDLHWFLDSGAAGLLSNK